MFGRELFLTPLGVKKPCTHYCTLLYFWRLINVPGRSGVSLIYGFYLNIFFKRGDTFVQFLFYFIYVLFTSTPTKYSLRFSWSVWNLNLKCVISVPLASLNEIAKITGFLNTHSSSISQQTDSPTGVFMCTKYIHLQKGSQRGWKRGAVM